MADQGPEDRQSLALKFTAGDLHCRRIRNIQIARQLGVPQAKVGEWIDWLYDNHYLRRTLDLDAIDGETRSLVGYRQCEVCLQQFLQSYYDPRICGGNRHVTRVKIVPSEPSEDSAEGWAIRLARHASGAAEYIARILLDARSDPLAVGVAWGRTVYETVKALASNPLWREAGGRKRFCAATTGELTWLSQLGPHYLSSSQHAEILASGARDCVAITLRWIQAYISMKEPESFVAAYKQYLGKSHSCYQQQEAIAKNLNAIITSLGNMKQPNKLWADALKDEGLGEKLMEKLEDIGGVLLHCDGLDKKEKRALSKLEDRWLGIKREQYKACAERAAPGVIVVAVGGGKVETTLRAVASGLVNVLVVDEELARALGGHLLAWDRARHGNRPGYEPERYTGGQCPGGCLLHCT